MSPRRLRLKFVLVALAAAVLHAGVAPGQPAGAPASPGAMEPEAAASSGEEIPEHRVADPAAPEVTPSNLLASERFWPYHVQLAALWKPPGAASPLPVGARGVLIRVESERDARIDFGRNGVFEVPVAATDLVDQANRVRRGEQRKFLPNFVEAIGPRLVSSEADPMREQPIRETYAHQGFLCVFADPEASGFADLAKALAPLRDRPEVMTILFPQGRPSDASVHAKLRSLGWTVPFVLQHLSEPYTVTLVGEKPVQPAVSLQSREGRLVLEQAWGETTRKALETAMAREFGAGETARVSPSAIQEGAVP
jgi:hypothetical protein